MTGISNLRVLSTCLAIRMEEALITKRLD